MTPGLLESSVAIWPETLRRFRSVQRRSQRFAVASPEANAAPKSPSHAYAAAFAETLVRIPSMVPVSLRCAACLPSCGQCCHSVRVASPSEEHCASCEPGSRCESAPRPKVRHVEKTRGASRQSRRGAEIRRPHGNGDRWPYHRLSYQPGPSANGDKIGAKADALLLDICVCWVMCCSCTQFAMSAPCGRRRTVGALAQTRGNRCLSILPAD